MLSNPYYLNDNTLYFPTGTYTMEQVQAAVAKKAFDPKYKPNQAPPYAKTELSLACAVICNYFHQICQYYGYLPTDWVTSSSNLPSPSI